jgi:2-(1,2-epoxy-1,2-dihydrophenyl)acetyl-CoA isomerase
LNRPKVYNAVNFELIDCLADHMVALSSDSKIRGVVISGEGKAFCSGGDLKWAASYPEGIQAAFHTLGGRIHQQS